MFFFVFFRSMKFLLREKRKEERKRREEKRREERGKEKGGKDLVS